MIPLKMTRYEKYKLTVHQVKTYIDKFHYTEHLMTIGGYVIHFEYHEEEKSYILFY